MVSSDLRRPVIAKTFGMRRDPGLSEVLNGSVKLDKAIRSISDIMLGEMSYEEIIKSPSFGNLWILPCGRLPLNPAEMLSSRKMVKLVEELRARFDYILFDSPPVLPVTDASLLAPYVDSVAVCYEIGRTARAALLRAKNQLQSSGANVVGLVLNHIAPQTEEAAIYPYKYAYKYGYYYGEDKEKGKGKSKPEEEGADEG
ncbi:CpsD/CapB family tyrosine-protein kinase [Candidatus Margulisiibacteriota bacterium]